MVRDDIREEEGGADCGTDVDGRLQSDKARQEEEQSRAAVRIDHFTAGHVPASRVPARLRSFAAALHASSHVALSSVYHSLLR